MTVAELRKRLAAYDPTARVLLVDMAGDCVEVAEVSRGFVADDGTGVLTVRDEPGPLERWRAKNAPHADLDTHPAAVLTAREDS